MSLTSERAPPFSSVQRAPPTRVQVSAHCFSQHKRHLVTQILDLRHGPKKSSLGFAERGLEATDARTPPTLDRQATE